MTSAPHHAVVYGPLKSRRLGTSLGINPVPTPREGCPEGCVVCQTGSEDSVPILSRPNQLPSAGVVVTSAARRIIELSKAGEKLDTITVSGNGDATKHPNLLEITENLRELRNKWFGKAELCLLADGLELERPEVRHALTIYDKPILRFEWGTAKNFAAMTGRPGTELKRRLELLAGLDKLVVQATFIQGGPDNSTETEVRNWLKKLEELRPREVQILTLEGPVKRGAKPKPVPVARLEEIAAEVTERIGVPVTVFARETQPV